MESEDIRAYATATERVAHEIELCGEVDPRIILDAIEEATVNPVMGFNSMCHLAAQCGINYLALGTSDIIADVRDVDATDLGEAQQAEYRIAYIRAANQREASEERMKVSEAAAILGVTPLRVRQMIGEGKLRGEKDGGLWMVRRSEVEELANR